MASRRDTDEVPDALSIGVVFGGTSEVDGPGRLLRARRRRHRYWDPELSRLMKQVIAAREGMDSPLCVNAVFHVDGELLPNVEFEGVRTGTFRRRTLQLMVQAAVPAMPVDDPRRVLVALLHQAIDAAEAFAARRSIAERLTDIRSILASLPAD